MNNNIKDIRKEIGKRFYEARMQIRATQEDFAIKCNYKKSTISAIENGRAFFSPEALSILIIDYGININYLITGQGSMFIDQKSNDNTDLNSKIDKIFEILERNNIR